MSGSRLPNLELTLLPNLLSIVIFYGVE